MRVLRDVMPVEDLRTARCHMCGSTEPCDDELTISSRCHPNAGTKVVYVKREHVLIITCRKCESTVVTLKLGTDMGALQ